MGLVVFDRKGRPKKFLPQELQQLRVSLLEAVQRRPADEEVPPPPLMVSLTLSSAFEATNSGRSRNSCARRHAPDSPLLPRSSPASRWDPVGRSNVRFEPGERQYWGNLGGIGFKPRPEPQDRGPPAGTCPQPLHVRADTR